MVKIKLQVSGKYAGLFRLPVIHKLLGDAAVQISTTLTESSFIPSETSTKKTSFWNNSTARIVVTGTQQDRLRIGKLLSDSHLFLQHPYVEECRDLEYCNPHYLV